MPFPVHVKTIAALRKGPIARGAISSIVIRVAALALGFVRDDSFEDNIRFFLEDDIER